MSIETSRLGQVTVAILGLMAVTNLGTWSECRGGITTAGLAEVVIALPPQADGSPNDAEDPVGAPSLNHDVSGFSGSSSSDPANQISTGLSSAPQSVENSSFSPSGSNRKRRQQGYGNSGPGGSGSGGGSGSRSGVGATGSTGAGTNLPGNNSLGTTSGGGSSNGLPAGNGGSASTGVISPGAPGGSMNLLDSQVAGSSAANPLLPSSTNGNSFTFQYSVTPGGLGIASPLYVDPPIATGYLFTLNAGPKIDTVTIVNPQSDLPNTPLITVSFDGHTGTVAPGGTFDFTQLEPGGVSSFTLTGISPLDVSANPSLDFLTSFTFAGEGPGTITEFLTSFTFAGEGPGTITETILDAPELGSTAIWLSGLTCCLACAWFKRQSVQQNATA